MAAITICSDFGTQENKTCHCFHFFPLYLPWSGGTRCRDLSFLNVDFQARFFQSPLSHSSRGSLVLPILGLIPASCFLLWHVTVCISYMLLCSTQPPNQVTWNDDSLYVTVLCLLKQLCYSHVGSLVQWRSTGQLAGVWAPLCSWLGWASWSLLDRFHPRLLCSMRISGQRSRRGSLQCGGPYPASACSLGCCPAGQGWSHGQNQNQCGKGRP